jgi:hypothetical protein
MIMFGSFLPSLGWLPPPKFTRAWEPTLSWNHLPSLKSGRLVKWFRQPRNHASTSIERRTLPFFRDSTLNRSVTLLSLTGGKTLGTKRQGPETGFYQTEHAMVRAAARTQTPFPLRSNP